MYTPSKSKERMYNQARTCVCGYTTLYRSNWCMHSKTCTLSDRNRTRVQQENEERDWKVRMLEAKNEELKSQIGEMRRQLETKDNQINQLIKRPRTSYVQNNRFIVNNNVNCFGRESLEHIQGDDIQQLLKNPETSIAQVVALQRTVPENVNVVIPNVRERRWLVVEEEGGEKRWKSKDKKEVLEQLWETGTIILEGEVDEDTSTGARWTKWVDRVRQNQDGKLYRDQMDMVENSILDQRDSVRTQANTGGAQVDDS